jgi:hypothetical protein
VVGEPVPEDDVEEVGDGGKNSGKAFLSMRWMPSSLNQLERAGTVN